MEALDVLTERSSDEQERLGYIHTLKEILQQPSTWKGTAELLQRDGTRETFQKISKSSLSHIVLTGSGSSWFVGEALAPMLQAGLGVPCTAVSAGSLLTHRSGVLPGGTGLLVSIARSGNSPESTAVVDQVLDAMPDYKHLVLTCNADGALAKRYRSESRVHVIVLDDATNDRSLVMTSSFTNLLLSGLALDSSMAVAAGPQVADRAADLFASFLERHADALSHFVSQRFDTAAYLASGPAMGIARESALKMLEMSSGLVSVLPETFLGLRHGPMSWLRRQGLLVAFLSSDPVTRAYEEDLLNELSRKGLGRHRVVIGEALNDDLVGPEGLGVELPGLAQLPEVYRLTNMMVVGQLLATFTCLNLGLHPDNPSEGVLTRVVGDFKIHR